MFILHVWCPTQVDFSTTFLQNKNLSHESNAIRNYKVWTIKVSKFKDWYLQFIFSNTRWCQMEKWWIPKFHCSLRWTIFISVGLAFDKLVLSCSTNFTCLQASFLNFLSECRTNEQCVVPLCQMKIRPKEVCRSCWDMKLWYSPLFHLTSSGV
jgi:hypothetical protein